MRPETRALTPGMPSADGYANRLAYRARVSIRDGAEMKPSNFAAAHVRPYALVLFAAALLVMMVVLHPTDAVVPLLANAVAMSLAVAYWQVQMPRADLTRPIYWINGTLAIFFIAHPTAMLLSHSLELPYVDRFDLRPAYPKALWLGVVAIVSMNLVYAISVHGNANLASRVLAKRIFDARRAFHVAMLLTVLSMVSTMYLDAKGFYTNTANGSAGAGTTAYLYLAPLLGVPASCLLVLCCAEEKKLSYRLVLFASLSFQIFTQARSGVRTNLLLVVAAPAMAYALKRKTQVPRFGVLLLLAVGLFGFGALRDVNAPGESFGNAVQHSLSSPSQLIYNTFTGADTEMVDALSVGLQAMPEVGYHPLIIPLSVIAQPIPRVFWPEKTPTADVMLNSYNFGRGANAAGVAYSFVGEGYVDGGVFGVIGLGALYAWILGRTDRLRSKAMNNWQIAMYAIVVPMAPLALRGVLAYVAAMFLFLGVPVLFTYLVGQRGTLA